MNDPTWIHEVTTVTGPYLTFDDVWLVPQFSEVESRKEIQLGTNIGLHLPLNTPLIAANMDTVCEDEMVIALLSEKLGTGVIHRYNTLEERVKLVKNVVGKVINEERLFGIVPAFGAAIGVNGSTIKEATELLLAGAAFVVIDVAHGHHAKVGAALEELDTEGLGSHVVAGNVATGDGAVYLAERGASTVKVGIGCGSICSTRLVTGHGIPQFSAILECREALNSNGFPYVGIIADGGIRSSGDILKALAAGANAVMVGSLFAGTTESPGQMVTYEGRKAKEYRGMASRKSQEQFFKNSPEAPEGVCTLVPFKGSIKSVAAELLGGIRSGISYSGAHDLTEFKEMAQWITGTFAGAKEAQTVRHVEV